MSPRRFWISVGALILALYGACLCREAMAQAPFDFDGDGKSDVLWRTASAGDVYVWDMNSLSIAGQGYLAQGVPLVWQIAGVGDFNGDGKADILWRNASAGDVYAWEMNGASIAAQGLIAQGVSPDWEVAGVGDFDGDGKADVLWVNARTGDVYLWEMNGTTIANQGFLAQGLPLECQIAGVGDFNGDGKADVLWRDTNTGDVYLWEMNGLTIASQGVIAQGVPLTWRIVGVGDLNGDGKADILWRNTITGDVYAWEMNGTTIAGQGLLSAGLPLAWQVAEIGDFNGDGQADILWHNAGTGDIYVWEMSGLNIGAQGTVAQGILLAWQVAPAPNRVFGLAFSPFLYPGQDPNQGTQISDAQLSALLSNLAPYTQWVRTFSLILGQQDIGAIAHSFGLKTAIGAYLDGNPTDDQNQVNALIQEAQAGNVDMAIVGNENLLNGTLTSSQIITYLQQVKAAVPANVLVTHADSWYQVTQNLNLLPYEDLAAINAYPFYENVSIDQALAQLQSDYQKTVQAVGNKPVWITETGWPSAGNPPSTGSPAVPSPQNAATYFSEVEQWARTAGIPLFFFEAYDEPWKASYNDYASWGIWDANLDFKASMTIPFR